MRYSRFFLTLAATGVTLLAFQQTTLAQAQQPAPNHVHYIEPPQQSTSPTGAVAPRLQKLGTYVFPVSTKNKQAQLFMNQGLDLSYAFNHAEAGRAYREAARLDPDLAMAFWGEALALGPNINAPMDPANEPKALEVIQKAVARSQSITTRTGVNRRLDSALLRPRRRSQGTRCRLRRRNAQGASSVSGRSGHRHALR